MKEVYIVTHQRPEDEESSGSFKTIGVYETVEAAHAAVARAQSRLGFKDFVSGFTVDRIDVEKDYWIEGFVSSDRQIERSRAGSD